MDQVSTIFNVAYDVPRFQISAPGRQSRAGDGRFRISPGVTEPVEFVFGNQDGVALNLVPFMIRLVFWRNDNVEGNLSGLGTTTIVLNKEVPVGDPYSGKVLIVLSPEDTFVLGQNGARSLRWGVFLLNQAGDVFPCTVTSSGTRFGTVQLDLQSGLPSAELIRGS